VTQKGYDQHFFLHNKKQTLTTHTQQSHYIQESPQDPPASQFPTVTDNSYQWLNYV